jgi:SAM-dependent methyltransferase
VRFQTQESNGTLAQRWVAFVFRRGNKRYESNVLETKRNLLAPLRGTVVEIGPGAGANLRFFAPDVRWIGFEPNPHMRPALLDEARRLGRPVDLRAGRGESMDLPNESADAVVATLVLCSVPSVEAVLAEVKRVLKPGGKLVFIEHVAAPPGTWLRIVQRALSPLWQRINDHCHLDRETGAAIERAGFASVEIQPFRVRFPLVAPHIGGVAVKR